MSYQELGCKNEESEELSRVGSGGPSLKLTQNGNCPSSTNHLYTMEVDISGTSTIVYESCFNPTTVSSLWSRHENKYPRTTGRTKNTWLSDVIPFASKFKDAYSFSWTEPAGWYNIIRTEAGYAKDEKGYLLVLQAKFTEQGITRGHLSPNSDFDVQFSVCFTDSHCKH